jgi:ribosome-associated toxin RatA of RatAB toxin-antitoxin module
MISSFSKQVTVPYSAEQMFELVNDVRAYSTFIDLCRASEVHEEQEHQLTATIKIAMGKLSFEFTTANTIVKGRSITMNLVRGPFKSLKGTWNFTPLENQQCITSLQFDFEFTNKLMSLTLDGLFKQLCTSMVESFRKQAAIRYG